MLTVITLAVAPLLLLLTKMFAGPLKKRWLESKEVESELTTVIQRSVASIGLVQAFGREADEFGRFCVSAENSVRANLRQAWQDSWYWLLIGAIFGFGYACIFAYGGLAVYKGTLSIGSLFVFLSYVNQVYGPLQSISASGASIQGGVAGVERVFEVLDRDPIIKDAPNAVHLPRQARVLKLDNVGFAYRENEPVLRDVDATIAPGQMVAFVGTSGVGKTTLLNLLPRFYDPTSGRLLLDDYDIRKVKIKDLRCTWPWSCRTISFCRRQLPRILPMAGQTHREAQIRHAAQQAGAASFIEKFEQGYNTVISESGGNISGGQRQRIGIALRAAHRSPLHGLRRAHHALDAQHEALFVDTLLRASPAAHDYPCQPPPEHCG